MVVVVLKERRRGRKANRVPKKRNKASRVKKTIANVNVEAR